MIDAPLATMNECQADAFQRAADVARTDLGRPEARKAAVALRNLDIVIDKAARSALELRQTWHAIWKDMESAPPGTEELRQTGERLRAGYERWSSILASMKQDAEQLAGRGHSLTSSPLLELAAMEVARLAEALEDNWPWADRPLPRVDNNLVAESRAAIARGEVQDIEDVIRELESRVRSAG